MSDSIDVNDENDAEADNGGEECPYCCKPIPYCNCNY